jgi:hypothetical protein
VHRGSVKKTDLGQINKLSENGYTLNGLFEEIVARREKSVGELSENRLIVRIGSQIVCESYNDF